MKSVQRGVIHGVIRVFRNALFIAKTETNTHRSSFERFSRFVKPPRFVHYKEGKLGGLEAIWFEPKKITSDRVILYLHGGGYCVGSAYSHRHMVARIARAAGCKAVAINYRLAPEDPHPAAVEDALEAYKALARFKFKHIYLAGDSAGGGLCLALMMRLRDEKFAKMPAGAVLLSPWVDLAMQGESIRTKANVDPLIDPSLLDVFASKYYNGHDPRDPYISPLYGDLSNLPPVYIQVGGHEVLLDDSTRLAKKLKKAGNEVQIEVWEGMMHVWQYFGGMMPEASQAIQGIGQFIRRHSKTLAVQETLYSGKKAVIKKLKIA